MRPPEQIVMYVGIGLAMGALLALYLLVSWILGVE
jgi:hypothetical protein